MAYNEYSGQCIGRMMRFLYNYSHQSDHWTFGKDGIFSGKEKVGDVMWIDDSDIPYFTFTPKYKMFQDVQEHKLRECVLYDVASRMKKHYVEVDKIAQRVQDAGFKVLSSNADELEHFFRQRRAEEDIDKMTELTKELERYMSAFKRVVSGEFDTLMPLVKIEDETEQERKQEYPLGCS